MIHYKSSFKVTSYSLEQSIDFLKKIKILTKKIKIGDKSIIYSKLKKRSNQNTILRSPHVNKKARDQIKIDHFSNLVSSKSKNLYKILKLMNANTSYKGNFTYVVKEKVYFILLTKNGRFTTNFI
jgi:ribosomal protein S10